MLRGAFDRFVSVLGPAHGQILVQIWTPVIRNPTSSLEVRLNTNVWALTLMPILSRYNFIYQ